VEAGPATITVKVTGAAKTDGFALEVTVRAAARDWECSGNETAARSRAATVDLRLE
jgi:hypothetical protein